MCVNSLTVESDRTRGRDREKVYVALCTLCATCFFTYSLGAKKVLLHQNFPPFARLFDFLAKICTKLLTLVLLHSHQRKATLFIISQYTFSSEICGKRYEIPTQFTYTKRRKTNMKMPKY